MSDTKDRKTRPRKKDDPDQSKRFIQKAKELECNQRVRPFERALPKLLKPKKAAP